MLEKRILDYYIDKKRRNYPTAHEVKKLDFLSDLFQYSDWIDKVGKEKYDDIMNFLDIPINDAENHYQEYIKMKESFSSRYINIYPDIKK